MLDRRKLMLNTLKLGQLSVLLFFLLYNLFIHCTVVHTIQKHAGK